ncbi:MAG: ABC transporter ATP-binding protein [Gammaproteobacteria bacterium]|nr:ABC transporter ATP-binding protein [Gammaproteobacteria bacterium]
MTIIAKNVIKEFGEPPTRVIQGIDLSIHDGEFVSISGRSGSGKSTLLYLLSTLDDPSYGHITIDGIEPQKMSVDELHRFRNQHLGFVFQFHFLLPELTALENVLLPARRDNRHYDKEDEARELFKTFGIVDKIHKLPSQLSGGEQQRVAIARALIMRPKYLFADEPTGSLDSKNGQIVMDILKRCNSEWGTTLVLVTHEAEYAAMAQREVFLIDGRVTENHTTS